jgi:LuxR family maltose regulon positive regulatory protein
MLQPQKTPVDGRLNTSRKRPSPPTRSTGGDGRFKIVKVEGQPTEVAMALLHQGSVRRALCERDRSQAAITEARSIIGSCPDPGILTGRLSAYGRSPRADTSSRDGKLTRRERRVLQLLTSDLSERDIGRELYVSHSTVHSHVSRSTSSSRAHALQRTHEP